MTDRFYADEDWTTYSIVPDSATVRGVLYRDGYPPGVLVRYEGMRKKPYAVFNNGKERVIDGRRVAPLLGRTAPNAKKLEGGKAITIYLDAQTRVIAERLGGGNISEGVRKALIALGRP